MTGLNSKLGRTLEGKRIGGKIRTLQGQNKELNEKLDLLAKENSQLMEINNQLLNALGEQNEILIRTKISEHAPYNNIKKTDEGLYISTQESGTQSLFSCYGERLGDIDRLEHWDSEQRYHVNKKGLKGVCSIHGEVLLPCEYTQIDDIDEDGYGYRELKNHKGLYGLADKNFHLLLEAKYYRPPFQMENWCWRVKSYGQKYGIVDENFKEGIPCVYDYVTLKDWIFVARKGEKYACFDQKFEERLPCEYNSISVTDWWYIEVKKDGKYWFFDKDFKEKIPCKYDRVIKRDGYFVVTIWDKEWALSVSDLSELLPCEYFSINDYQNWILLVMKERGSYSLIRDDWTVVLPDQENCIEWDEKKNCWIVGVYAENPTFLDKDGKEIISK